METFRTFKDVHAARELAIWLSDRGIRAEVADINPYFDPSFAHSILTKEYAVRILAADFLTARDLLHQFYQLRLNLIPGDYYLFSFTDSELEEILRKPDEWGDLDYALAQHILASRNKGFSEKELELLSRSRYEALSRPEEEEAGDYIRWGYILAIAGGFIGSLIGLHLSGSRKVLPDGNKVPRFSEHARKHGRRIFRIGLGVSLAFGLYRMYVAYRTGNAFLDWHY